LLPRILVQPQLFGQALAKYLSPKQLPLGSVFLQYVDDLRNMSFPEAIWFIDGSSYMIDGRQVSD
jgi:hypothetical protein